MTPAEIRADYRAQMLDVGWSLTLRRTNPSPTAPIEVPVLGRITDLDVDDFVGNRQQGDRKAIVLAEDIEAGAIALPLRTTGTDKIVDNGTVFNIQAVDRLSRKVKDVVIAYQLLLRGAA